MEIFNLILLGYWRWMKIAGNAVIHIDDNFNYRGPLNQQKIE